MAPASNPQKVLNQASAYAKRCRETAAQAKKRVDELEGELKAAKEQVSKADKELGDAEALLGKALVAFQPGLPTAALPSQS
eukprot:13919309-Alexandrium_andersonii.AAC.1